MLPVDRHASPTFLAILGVFHDEVTSKVFNTFSLFADGIINNLQWRAVSQVKILPMPRLWKKTPRG
jgi:hypothetical protein